MALHLFKLEIHYRQSFIVAVLISKFACLGLGCILHELCKRTPFLQLCPCSFQIDLCIGNPQYRSVAIHPGSSTKMKLCRKPKEKPILFSQITWNAVAWTPSRTRAGGKTLPVPSPGRGPHVCSGASCYVWEKISGRVQMYDGCCSVR